jgi:hypothetical protein
VKLYTPIGLALALTLALACIVMACASSSPPPSQPRFRLDYTENLNDYVGQIWVYCDTKNNQELYVTARSGMAVKPGGCE